MFGAPYSQLEFDYVGGPGTSQASLFMVAGRPLVTKMLAGINSALLAYVSAEGEGRAEPGG